MLNRSIKVISNFASEGLSDKRPRLDSVTIPGRTTEILIFLSLYKPVIKFKVSREATD